MNTDRYKHPLPEDEPTTAPAVPVKPHLAERLREANKPKPFDAETIKGFEGKQQ